MHNSILIVGKTPPPVGGVSVFVSRQYNSLKQSGVNVGIHNDFSPLGVIKLLVRVKRYDQIYIHFFSLLFMLFFSLLRIQSRALYVDHNKSSRLYKDGFKWWVMACILKRCKAIFVVSHHLADNYPDFLRKKIFEISTFLPPSNDELNHADVPISVKNFISSASKYIVVSAWRVIYERNVELYGIGFSLDVFKGIGEASENVKMVLCIGDPDYNIEEVGEIRRKINALDLDNKVMIWEGASCSWAIFGSDSIYFRPTSTDGNSVSIHEAMYFGSQVVASDVVPRPNGVKTFSYGDVESALDALKESLK